MNPESRGGLLNWFSAHPIAGIMLVALIAVVINCYPVVFCGRSYVSPASGNPLVYERWPTLPGTSATPITDVHGSDSAATMVWCVPVTFIESRSLLEQGEVSLWNRYSHAGDTLIGQAVSMIGDPLHWIVILGRGSAGAWDLKFLLAKFLFCVGFGWLILRLFSSLPLSLLFAALSAYCGAFFYIYSHPSFFVFCYAPWILLSATQFLDLQTMNYSRWGAVWLVVNFSCLNAGDIELASILIGGLNLSALALALTRSFSLAGSARVLARLTVAGALFLALAAPFWLPFLTALQGAFSLHSKVKVFQFSPTSLLGIFDDVFFRLPKGTINNPAPAPGSSLMVGVATILSLLRWRQFKREPGFWINMAALLLWGGCVFGWVPSSVLSAVPLLNRIGHTQTVFCFLLEIHLLIQCAYGFKGLVGNRSFRGTLVDLLLAGLIFGAIVLMYALDFGFRKPSMPWAYFALAIAGAFGAPFLFVVLRSRNPSVPAVGWIGIIVLGFIPHVRFGIYNFGPGSLLMIPGPRTVLNPPSQAIEIVKADHSTPFRTVGLEWTFFGDYAAAYGLEDIRSCAPLSNDELVSLLRAFPGMASYRASWQVALVDPGKAQALLNLLNVKYILASGPVNPDMALDFRVIMQSDMSVVENLDVWPRAYFLDHVIPLSSREDFMRFLNANGKQPFAALTPEEIAAHPEISGLVSSNKPTISPATNFQLLANSTAFDVQASSAGLVCLTEGEGKDFVATANGVRKTVLTVNRAFKGIYLDQPGNYHIEFIYRPRYWRLACVLFWFAAASAIILVLILGRRTSREPESTAGNSIPPPGAP